MLRAYNCAMACDASKVFSTLQSRALETEDRDGLATSLATTLESAFARAWRVSVWWKSDEGEGLEEGPSAGDPRAIEAARADLDLVRDAIEASGDRLITDRSRAEPQAGTGRSRLVVSIRSMGRVVGAIDLGAREPGAFGEVDRCVLRAVADSFGGLVATPDVDAGS